MEKRDFNFLVNLIEQFFQQSHIQNRLSFIDCNNITGWEIWLQIEFSVFLDAQLDIAYWEREFQYSIDRRKAKDREYMAIDFTFRKKHAALGQHIALEIKQNNNIKSCIRGMMEDVCKVSMVKGSHDNIRSIWNLGIHPHINEEELLDIVNEYANTFNVVLVKNCVLTNAIKRTNLAYTLF